MIYREIDSCKTDSEQNSRHPFFIKEWNECQRNHTNNMHSSFTASATDQLQGVYAEKNAPQIAEIYLIGIKQKTQRQ